MKIKTRIEQLISHHGTLRGVSRETKIDIAYLHRLYKGDMSNPSDEILEKLGLIKVVDYRLRGE